MSSTTRNPRPAPTTTSDRWRVPVRRGMFTAWWPGDCKPVWTTDARR
jgi:hypothetical protein